MAAIRELHVGVQLVKGVAPATYTRVKFKDFKYSPKATRLVVEEDNGTREQAQEVKAGVQHGEFSGKLYIRYDHIGWFLVALMNSPVSVAHPSALGAMDHTFKHGGSVPYFAFRWKEGTSGTWYQALDQAFTAGDFTLTPDKLVEFDYKSSGALAAKIVAPSPLTYSEATYNQPVYPALLALTKGGTAWKVRQAKLSWNNGRTPYYEIGGGADPSDMEEGYIAVTFDITSRFVAHVGSVYEAYLGNTDPGVFVISMTGTDDIGTGTPTKPLLRLTIHKPRITDGELDESKGTTEQNVKGRCALSTTDATSITALLTNEVTAYTGS